MKNFGKILTGVLAFSLALLLASCGTETEQREMPLSRPAGDWSVEVTASGIEYLGSTGSREKIIQVFCFDKLGNLVELSLADYAEIKNQTSVIDESLLCEKKELTSRTPKVSAGSGFASEESFTALGAGEKISPDFKGVCTVSIKAGEEFGYVVSDISTSSGTVNGAVASGADFVWNAYLPVKVNNELSFNIPEGEIAYAQFAPYLNVTLGRIDGDTVWGASPIVTASGGADGLLEIVIR